MRLYTIGVDVGGTNVKMGLVAPSGKIIARTILITESYIRHPRYLINALALAIHDLIKDNGKMLKDIAGIGIGLPGLIDVPHGSVIFMPNIPGWQNIPLRRIMEKKMKVPVFLDNDVNVITLGEWKFGAGQGCANLVCITLGTGVGGGLIFNNALYRGEGFVAGEIGHVPLNENGPSCNCGGYACFERYVGNRTLMRNAAKLFRDKSVRLQDVFALAKRGDKQAIRFWEDAARHIGNALVGVVNLLNPRMIIIGGGVANNFRFMGPTIREVIRQRAMKIQGRMVRVVRAKLGDDAGILGAHILVKGAVLGR